MGPQRWAELDIRYLILKKWKGHLKTVIRIYNLSTKKAEWEIQNLETNPGYIEIPFQNPKTRTKRKKNQFISIHGFRGFAVEWHGQDGRAQCSGYGGPEAGLKNAWVNLLPLSDIFV